MAFCIHKYVLYVYERPLEEAPAFFHSVAFLHYSSASGGLHSENVLSYAFVPVNSAF